MSRGFWYVQKGQITEPIKQNHSVIDREQNVAPASSLPSPWPLFLQRVEDDSPGDVVITTSSNFHKHVWLIVRSGRLDLKTQENNEQNITWLVIRGNVSGEDISGKVRSVLFSSTTAVCQVC